MYNKLVLFGAGYNGQKLVQKWGDKCEILFCDNSEKLIGKKIQNIIVISFDEMIKKHKEGYAIIVTPFQYVEMVIQLEMSGVFDYIIYAEIINKSVVFDEVKHLNRKHIELNCTNFEHDLETFRSKVCDIIEHKEIVSFSGRLAESSFYGHYNILMRYGKIENDIAIYGPEVCHVSNQPNLAYYFRYNAATVVAGDLFYDNIHKRRAYVPILRIGSYIQYAESMLSKAELLYEKNKLGKTLLVFVPHTIENQNKYYDEKKYVETINSNYCEYDSILFCVYWADICKPITYYAEELGMKVVTAGVRTDPRFMDRLKTFFELSDGVLCGDIGAFIPYAISLNKPVGCINMNVINTEVQNVKVVDSEKMKFEKEMFGLLTDRISYNQRLREYCNYISGFKYFRSPDDINCFFHIAYSLWVLSDFKISNYPDSVRKLYKKYWNEGDIVSLTLLKETVGFFLE